MSSLPEDIFSRSPAVREAMLIQAVRNVERRMDNVARALWSTAGALVLASVTFAFAVASGQIG